ncbi:MAG: M48 family metalloprotease [Acidobacteria bacterium]|nr:M48 family metalloprotease [Acidobacteriota bacterium]
MRFFTKVVLSAVLLAFGLVPGWGCQFPEPSQAEPDFPIWQAPTPPAKGKTRLLPKPGRGHNIFKGEAEQWLVEYLTPDEVELGDPVISTYLNQVVNHLTTFCPEPTRHFQVVVLDEDLPDAFCQGDGKIYITVGFLKMMESEDELAGVLAHEMGHEALKHIPKTLSRQLLWMIGTTKITSREQLNSALTRLSEKYQKIPVAAFMERLSGISRMDELKADQCAVATLFRAGYNPRALITILARAERYQKEAYGKGYGKAKFVQFWLGTHPPTSFRKLAFQLERMFIKLPPKDTRYPSQAFEAMKALLEKADEEGEEKEN